LAPLAVVKAFDPFRDFRDGLWLHLGAEGPVTGLNQPGGAID
jgi:hypothetical protein